MHDETETIDHRDAAHDAEIKLAQTEATAAAPEDLKKGDKVPTMAERLKSRASDTHTKHAPDAECAITGSHPYTACGKVRASEARANAEAAKQAAAEADNAGVEGNTDAPAIDEGSE